MTPDLPTFNSRAVRPMECISSGWQLIKKDYWLFLGITVVGTLIGGLAPMGILMGPAMCGIYLCLLRQSRGYRVSFDMLFKGFDYFAQSLIAALVSMAAALLTMLLVLPVVAVIFIPLIVMVSNQPRGQPADPAIGWVFAVSIILAYAALIFFIIIQSALFLFTFPLIVDKELSGMDAVRVSIKAGWANLRGVVGLVLLSMLLSIIGVLACYVGALLVIPIHCAAIAMAYRQVFPSEELPQVLPVEPPPFDSHHLREGSPP